MIKIKKKNSNELLGIANKITLKKIGGKLFGCPTNPHHTNKNKVFSPGIPHHPHALLLIKLFRPKTGDIKTEKIRKETVLYSGQNANSSGQGQEIFYY